MTTTKWTCDADGNWRQVTVTLVRKGAGWIEVPASEVGRAA